MGSVGAALGTRGALLRTKAKHVVFLGICAGVPGKVELGDVVIPRTVIYFEPGKVGKGRFGGQGRIEYADDQRHCDPGVLGRAALLRASLDDQGIKLRADDDVMACGEKVVASKRFRDNQIRLRHRKIAAIDMESYGVALATEEVGRKLTVIKGVCDMADHRKNDEAHAIAARNAAEVFVKLVEEGAFRS
jgi:nucleoside phosphorylase